MKYVILIHSNPQPWGHPTGAFMPEALARPQEERERSGAAFEAMLEELSKSGELKGGEALGDPVSSRIYRWSESGTLTTDGPYAESKEHLAGFFLLDLASPERAEELAVNFAGPGDTVELRPAYVWED